VNQQRLAARRRYITRFIPAMSVYAILVVLMMPLVRSVDPIWAKMLLALVPTVPVAFAVMEIVRFIASQDELERRLQFEAVGVAALLTCFLTFAWGLLENAGVPRLPVVMVTPLFCSIYGLAVWRAHRRFQ